jgi:hypothetical protein
MFRIPAALILAALLPACAGVARAQDVGAAPHRDAARESTWKGAFEDSLRLLLAEHAIRIAFQEKTRHELSGPFWADYRRSLRVPNTWEDGDSWLVNYIGHPMHGAAAGRIWLDHSAAGRADVKLSQKQYWASRAVAGAWAAAYSLQFEFGPLSEASIGNVGLNPATAGWVDHAVTPAGALALIVAEDGLDKYFVKFVERHTRNTFYRISLRVLFNPSRTMANLAQLRAPWHRFDRTLR